MRPALLRGGVLAKSSSRIYPGRAWGAVPDLTARASAVVAIHAPQEERQAEFRSGAGSPLASRLDGP